MEYYKTAKQEKETKSIKKCKQVRTHTFAQTGIPENLKPQTIIYMQRIYEVKKKKNVIKTL